MRLDDALDHAGTEPEIVGYDHESLHVHILPGARERRAP
jgi:hypothetical protein